MRVRIAALVLLAASHASADEVQVSLLTFSPDAHPFLSFGHSALWIHDPRMATDDVDLVYNFGTFAFGSPSVIADFARGQLSYWLSVGTLAWTLESYGGSGRTVRSQRVNLTPAEADRLERALVEGLRPESRFYAYGYVENNCATRLRDALDEASGGALRAAFTGSTGRTFRAEVARVLGDRPVFGAMVDAAMGPALDRPVDAWSATFVPDRLAAALRRGTRDGGAPLVVEERTLVDHRRWFPERAAAHPRAWALAIGAVMGLVLGGPPPPAPSPTSRRGGGEGKSEGALRFEADVALPSPRTWRGVGGEVLLGAHDAVLGAAIGGAGSFLLLFGVIHPLARWNVNVLHAAPSALWLVREGVRMARGEPAASGRALRVSGLGLALSATGLVLSLTGATPQPVGGFAALVMPLWVGLVARLWRATQPGGGRRVVGGGGGVADDEVVAVGPVEGGVTGVRRSGGGAP